MFYVAYHVHHDGSVYRRPFAAFPHAAAARRWLEGRDDKRVRFVPPLPPSADCGCLHPLAAGCDHTDDE